METEYKNNAIILVVEESLTQAEQIKYILEQKDYKVFIVSNGQDAINYLIENQPNLIICNTIIPDMSGFELSAEVKKIKNHTRTPFVLYLALTETEELVPIIQSGADSFLAKPFKPSTLLSKVQSILINDVEIKEKEILKDHDLKINFNNKEYNLRSSIARLTNLLFAAYESASIKSSEVIQTKNESIATKDNYNRKNEENKQLQEQIRGQIQSLIFDVYHPIQQVSTNFRSLREANASAESEKTALLQDMDHLLKGLEQDLKKILPTDPAQIPLPKLSLEETNILKTLTQLIDGFKPILDKRSIAIDIHFPEQLGLVMLDKGKITHVLSFLLNQSTSFSKQGSKINIYIDDDEKIIEIKIKDETSGFLPKDSSLLFKHELATEFENSKILQQLRLDLFYCKRIIEQHEGVLDYKTSSEPFTEFSIKLPKELSMLKREHLDKDPKSYEVPNWHSKNILIVDDVLSNYKYLKGVLLKTHAQIEWVQTGEEAIEYCRSAKKTDLILMDIHMPGLNGFETTKRIRTFNKDVKIVAQTAYDMHGENEKCLAVGCNGYLPMPIKPYQLIKEIDKHF